jgi:hypothetical protein
MEISVGDDEMGDRADCENSEDKPTHRRNAVAEDRKKSLHMSTRLTHSLKKRGKMEVGCRVPRIAIEDVKDAEKEQATSSSQKVFLARSLLPHRDGDYHMMLRLISDGLCSYWCYQVPVADYSF